MISKLVKQIAKSLDEHPNCWSETGYTLTYDPPKEFTQSSISLWTGSGIFFLSIYHIKPEKEPSITDINVEFSLVEKIYLWYGYIKPLLKSRQTKATEDLKSKILDILT